MLSPKGKRLLKKVLPHQIIFLIGGILFVVIERGLLGDLDRYPATGNFYSFHLSISTVLTIGILLGGVLGLLEEYLFKNILLKVSFFPKLVLKTVLYVSILFVTIIISSTLPYMFLLNLSFDHPAVLQSVKNFTNNFALLSVLIYTSTIISTSLLFSEMLDYMGFNAVTNFFTGKYTRSTIESRVFMFLDMRSSTSIAEKLGHEAYYKLLNRYFADMTNAILNTEGEVYQYVGDEIVLSWDLKVGTKNNNCLRCFFQIQEHLKEQQKIYLEQFGLMPEFKAGLHFGEVSMGVVGRLKKEILFTGDVLNSTSRMQGLCNQLQTDLLISEELRAILPITDEFILEDKGAHKLRGRGEEIALVAVSKQEHQP